MKISFLHSTFFFCFKINKVETLGRKNEGGESLINCSLLYSCLTWGESGSQRNTPNISPQGNDPSFLRDHRHCCSRFSVLTGLCFTTSKERKQEGGCGAWILAKSILSLPSVGSFFLECSLLI